MKKEMKIFKEKREIPSYLNWKTILEDSVNKPGIISKAYSAFHGYSLGNRLAALIQCSVKEIEPGPIDTFKRWYEKGRKVKKGEKALFLCMPKACKSKREVLKPDGKFHEEEITYNTYFWTPRWFVLSQTEGDEIKPNFPPNWNREKALAELDIKEENFTSLNGNSQGYAYDRTIAINPLNDLPHKTVFHECAHILLSHTQEEGLSDDERTPRNLQEVEAEAVALICCESLGLPGAEYSRGYIQNWYGQNTIPEKSAQKIFKAADEILKAGLTEREVSS